MKTYTLAEVTAARNWRPQVERLVVGDTIYVVETQQDYAQLPAAVLELIVLRDSL